MRIVKVFNKRKVWGGEDRVVETVTKLLRAKGNYVYPWLRSTEELGNSFKGKMKAFISGIYSPAAGRSMSDLIDSEKPDVVHAHNFLPLFSPAVFASARRKGIPTLLHCHSYLLTCPTTFHLTKEKLCTLCFGGREYWCVLKNCRNSLPESIAYGFRNFVHRKLRLLTDSMTLFIVLTEFAKRWLIRAGFDQDQIVVLPNMVAIPQTAADPTDGGYVAYLGRISTEKGVDLLLSAASQLPDVPIKIAGDGPLRAQLEANAGNNVLFTSWIDRPGLDAFYRQARFVVVPSRWFEPFGLVTAEAMAYGIPVIASRIGGLPELVDDGITGLLFDPGNASDLADKMKLLWGNLELCRRMGVAAREKATREYSEDVYYRRLISIYNQAITRCDDMYKF